MDGKLVNWPRIDKLGGMASLASLVSPRRMRPDAQALLRRLATPLPTGPFLATIAAGVVIGVIYCQIWCLVAFPPTERMPMPLQASLAWSFSAIAPWLIAVELGKRRSEIAATTAGRRLALVLIFAFAAFLAIIVELGLDHMIGVHETRPLPLQLASQLPAAVMTGVALAASGYILRHGPPPEAASSGALATLLARASEIEWVEAAGNYAEIHEGGRSSLHRVTMRELEQALDPSQFTRIHRSTIVNGGFVAARLSIGGAPGVRLRDGTVLKIGRRYAGCLD